MHKMTLQSAMLQSCTMAHVGYIMIAVLNMSSAVNDFIADKSSVVDFILTSHSRNHSVLSSTVICKCNSITNSVTVISKQ